jgi:hypothetical protein
MSDFFSNILCETSTRADGNMSFRIGATQNSLGNRKQFLMDIGIDFQDHISMKCDHGAEISVVTSDTIGAGATTQEDMILAEVLVTQEKGLALMLLTADCLPVSFYDPVTQTIALAHFSRETIANLLPQKTISFLREQFDIDPPNLLIHVGPHIHTSSYSFPADTHTIQSNLLPFTKEKPERMYVDLISACKHQLTQFGVSLENTTVSEINTATSSDHFSHYASRTQNAPEGRIATVLMLR